MDDERRLGDAIAALYESAALNSEWPATLRPIADLIGADEIIYQQFSKHDPRPLQFQRTGRLLDDASVSQ